MQAQPGGNQPRRVHHEIKRLNRVLEIRLHNLELETVRKAVGEGIAADGQNIHPLMNTLLVHQFHDILPGTPIHSVNVETQKSIGKAVDEAAAKTRALIATDGDVRAVTLVNPLSFDREDTLYIPANGEGVENVRYADVPCGEKSPFVMDGNVLTTPFARITRAWRAWRICSITRRCSSPAAQSRRRL